ncbi:MAG: 4Fe-4S dicluster domain-containing protein [Clostridia bacterium]|nr:4Fe-4S dicluster domain-containing protein [Clostridia bacterium]
MKKCSKENIYKVFNALSSDYSVYVPVKEENRTFYKKYFDGVVLAENFKTDRSAKDFFFPQSEDLMKFKTQGKSIEIIDEREESEDFIIFGVPACDEASLRILDRVFLAEPVDTYYQNKREHGVIITTACSRPEASCFCSTFDIDMARPQGDIRTYKIGDYFYFEGLTDKGNKVLDKVNALLEDVDQGEVEKEIENIQKVKEKLPLKDLSVKDFGADKTQEFFDRKEWAELSNACLGCGTCTFVCPTCQCYDIKDFNTGKGVQRYRCWDSCMYSDFTKMAHGNSRNSQMERFRQRFMHKLVYFPTNNDGVFSCVGCGRCVSKCPISMNIVKVIKTLSKGGENE